MLVQSGAKSAAEHERGSIRAPARPEYADAKSMPVDKPGLAPKEMGQKALRGRGLERLQEIFMTDDLLDASHVAELVAALPKVEGALIMRSDGTFMSGELPGIHDLDSALLAPVVMRTVQEFSRQLKSSESSSFTIFGDPLISIFLEGEVCILIAHQGRGLLPGVLERICKTASALDAMCAGDSI